MSKNLFEELAKNHYILYFDGELVVTNKFYRDFKVPPPPDKKENPVPIINKSELTKLTPPTLNSKVLTEPPVVENMPLRRFIKDVDVPEKIATKTGAYWANRYSIPAEKVLITALTKGMDYKILVAATKLYYKSGGQPKAISNFFIEGTYLGCYQDMLDSLQNNTVTEHISKNLDKGDEEGYTRYKR